MGGDTDNQSWTRQELERAWPLDPAPPGKQVLMRIRDLNKRFGPRHILRGIDLDIYKGETLVILGGSGSGKTTLIRHLMGFLVSDTGSVLVGDLDLNTASTRQLEHYRKRLGVVFQMAALLN